MATLRQCMKWMRPRAPMRRVMAGRSLFGSAPSEPVQSVTPLAGLSTRSISRSNASPLVMIRGSPKIDQGGSSGWIAMRTPARSASGATRSRK